jgi:hypothetical protein
MSPAQTGTPAPSFMQLVKKTGKLAKTGRSRIVDPLTEAKSKILAALGVQEGYARLLNDGQPLPKKGDKTVSTWFSKQNDGWWTQLRYGNSSIAIVDGHADMLIGDIKDVMNFYAAVKIAIGKGELDAQIGKLQAERSATLTKGKT